MRLDATKQQAHRVCLTLCVQVAEIDMSQLLHYEAHSQLCDHGVEAISGELSNSTLSETSSWILGK